MFIKSGDWGEGSLLAILTAHVEILMRSNACSRIRILPRCSRLSLSMIGVKDLGVHIIM